LTESLRQKSVQVTELNRQLKATTENSQKAQRALQKRNRDLEKMMKAMEKELMQLKARGESQQPADGSLPEDNLKRSVD